MKKKLNIFFSNSISKHKWGGGEKWMVTAAKGLSKRGHNVYISGKANSILLNKATGENLKTVPLNIYADYNPLSYYPLSLWSWQDTIKAVFLDRVNIVAE